MVLDNCEHVVDTVAELIGPLLRAGAGVKVLATSQLPLGVDGERVYGVEPLSFEDAVGLFTQRASEQGQAFEEAGAVQCGGGGVPVPRRAPPGHRARGGAYEVALPAGDLPAPR